MIDLPPELKFWLINWGVCIIIGAIIGHIYTRRYYVKQCTLLVANILDELENKNTADVKRILKTFLKNAINELQPKKYSSYEG
ncbi:MAG: hypothetical protein HQ568_05695 [Calditrichaeota bacterium]|nr:hypothetical protein [Calditrichota bacterium]